LSCLSGNHMQECPPVVHGLRDAGCDDVVVVVGGTISPDDRRRLEEIGVHGVFGTGSALPEIIDRISGLLDAVRPPSRARSW
jgi:methylmalonyl-CoA mutase C-terminal domain/subunit